MLESLLAESLRTIAICFGVSFISVFIKVTQQENIIHDRRVWAACTSFIMVGLDVVLVGLISQNGLSMLIPSGFGGALGVFLSMTLYPKDKLPKVHS
jgi:hypothetical protein